MIDQERVNIIDALDDAVNVPAHDVRVGDYVFSTTGAPSRVVKVAARGARTVRIDSERLWPLQLDATDCITIRRSASYKLSYPERNMETE